MTEQEAMQISINELKNYTTEEIVEILHLRDVYQTSLTDGDSAYQVAVNNGFIGTEEEWLESLKSDNEIDYQKLFEMFESNPDTFFNKVPENVAKLIGIEGIISFGRDNVVGFAALGTSSNIIFRDDTKDITLTGDLSDSFVTFQDSPTTMEMT